MNAQAEVRTLVSLQAKTKELNYKIINLPSDTPAAEKLALKKAWNKAREAERIFIFQSKPALTARGTLLRH